MSELTLENDSRVAVIGGGPAGSFFAYFMLVNAARAEKRIEVHVYEPHDFDRPGPAGCNNCGGIISEWLVQSLAADGINLPSRVVEQGIDSYVMHTDVGDARIDTPLHEKRIGAVHRGAGPRGAKEIRFQGFDSFLLGQACRQGAQLLRGRVDAVEMRDGHPFVKKQGGEFQEYDLLCVATGKNHTALKMFDKLNIGYQPPRATKTYISEIFLGEQTLADYLGSSMHVFLLNLPRLDFAALIPKGDYATMCLLGEDVDRDLVQSFLSAPEVKMCLPPDWTVPTDLCHCSPLIQVAGAKNCYADRIVFVGDCGVSRLNKDGIGTAYRAAKAAARTAVFTGISKTAFASQYKPLLDNIALDNQFGRFIFMVTHIIQVVQPLRRGMLRMVADEQQTTSGARRMSTVLWDTFTGSAPYREVFFRTIHPGFWLRYLYDIAAGLFAFRVNRIKMEGKVSPATLGRVYKDGDVLFNQGEVGDCMYVIQAGQVEILREENGAKVQIAVRGEGDIIGEMAIVEHQTRSATARVKGEARILTVDKKAFLRRVHEDPSLAYRIMQSMSARIRSMSEELARVKAKGSDDGAAL